MHPYISFNGNCREAMEFYHKCLGGALHFQTVGDSPLSEKLPTAIRKFILHASLTCENFVLMGSDIVSEKGLVKGNTISILLHCVSETEARVYYKKLSRGGKQMYPLELTFWGDLFGSFADKYGNYWMLTCDNKKSIKKKGA